MTRPTWIVGVILVALGLLFDRCTPPMPYSFAYETHERVATARYRAVLLAALEAHVLLDVARWEARPQRDTLQVSVEPGVPAEVPHEVARQLEALHLTGNPRLRVRIVPVEMSGTGPVRSPAEKAPFTVTWTLPRDGVTPCRVLLQMRDGGAETARLLGQDPVPGPCHFYAAFGQPGPQVRAWLDTARHSMATRPVPAPLSVRLGATPGARVPREMLPLGAARCLVGDDAACLDVLGLRRNTAAPRVPGDPYTLDAGTPVDLVLGRVASGYGQRLGSSEGRLLSDLLTDVGPARFAAFWTSPDPVEVAFERAIGTSLPQWTRAWLGRTYETRPPGPAVPARVLAGMLVLTVGLLGLGAAGAARRGTL